jgi:ubiquinone/menaquinone biosynthesis C-methylase UbiE
MRMKHKRRAAVIAFALLVLLVVLAHRIRRMRGDPTALPYDQRRWAEFPRPLLSRARLRDALRPEAGQRMLEVGPGTGYYSLHAASWLLPRGTLEILDGQQDMLDHTMSRASAEGVENITLTRGDAQELPYVDDVFDAAYLVATLGEVPDKEAALTELRRVLKPGGILVIGEGQPDPHMIGFRTLRGLAETTGLSFKERIGGPLGYFASFEVS